MSKYFMAVSATALMVGAAQAATLSNGTGDGTVTVDVDLYGSFGSASDFGGTDAFFDPVGPIGEAGTIFESYVYGNSGTGRAPLSAISGAATLVSATDTTVISSFEWNALDIVLTQSLADSFDDGERVGSTLTQSFAIQNTDVLNSFDLVRYVDGDLQFDGSIDDSGGITELGGQRIVFETDGSSEGGSVADTFLGVTSSVIGDNLSDREQNFAIDSYSGLQEEIEDGADLDNDVAGDNDGDGFIDVPYDVTLATQDFFTIPAGGAVTYTTSTLFGNAVPAAPGSSEALPLLPSDIGPDGGFQFDIPADAVAEGQTIWIDPIVATGYTYEVTGATFASVTAPSFGSVADPDGYVLTFGLDSVALASGETFVFNPVDMVGSFTLTGIDVDLFLDPGDVLAFPTGVSFADIGAGIISVTQTPITFDTDADTPAPIPLPASILMLGAGLAGLGAVGRRKRRAA